MRQKEILFEFNKISTVRNSVNAQGRFHQFQTRQREARQREAETREAEEAATQARPGFFKRQR